MREERLESHPITIPDASHGPRRMMPSPSQPVRPGHRPRATVLALIIMVVMAAVVGTLTWAYFSDTATTTATFSSGTVDLLICDGEGCYPSLPLDPMTDIYPGWSETVTLGLKNLGTLRMNVSFQASGDAEADNLGGVVEVTAYAAATPGGQYLYSGTIYGLEAITVTYGVLEPAPADPVPITFVFTWPETGEDQTGLTGQTLAEEVTFYGTTEGVGQE